MCVLSHVQLFGTSLTAAYQSPLSRQKYWNGLPFPTPEDLPNPGVEPTSSAALCIGRWILYRWATWETLHPNLSSLFLIYISSPFLQVRELRVQRVVFLCRGKPDCWNFGILFGILNLATGKRPWCWQRWKAEREGGDRVWGGWTASPIQWTWAWANSRRQWRTEELGLLQSTRSQSDMTQQQFDNNK